jgi:hypothetical protein
MPQINWLAVTAATLSTFALGAIWYSPALFGKAWMRANRLTEADLKGRNMGMVLGLSFVFSFLMAANLAAFLGAPTIDARMAGVYGFLTGFGWVALGLAIIALFEARPWPYVLINGGYMSVAFTLMGIILGAWR